MIFCYLDESGVADIPGNTSHYVLAALSMPVDKWKRCEREVQKIKTKYFLQNSEIHTAWILSPYFEQRKISDFEKLDYSSRVHETEKYRTAELLRLQKLKNQKQYFQTKKNYSKTKAYIHLTQDERKRFILEIAALIASWDFCRLFAECIDKINFNMASPPSVDEQAFEQVVTRIEHYLKIYSKSSRITQFGLLIHDNNDTVKKKHTQMMKHFHERGTFWTTITNIIETPMFVDSQLTSMVQLVDVCSYALRKYLENKDDTLFKEIFKIADTKDGKVVGIRHFTKGCDCIICKSHK